MKATGSLNPKTPNSGTTRCWTGWTNTSSRGWTRNHADRSDLLRALGGWGDGDEVFGEALAVGVEEFVDAIEAGGADDQAGVVALLYAVDDLVVDITGSVGRFLFCEREDDSGVLLARGSDPRRSFAVQDLQPGPFAPQVNT